MKYDGETDWEIMNTVSVRNVLMLFRSRNQLWDNDHKIVNEYGLTWAQFNTLAALRQAPFPHRMVPTELYDAVQVTSGGLTKVLTGLEDQGHLIRISNSSDHRSKYAQLTIKGRELIEKIAQQLALANSATFNLALSADEQVQLAELMKKLCAALDRGAGKPTH